MHIYVFFYFQNTTNEWLRDHFTLLVYYILQMWFIILSACQIKDGYPVFPAGKTQEKEYTALSGAMYKTWRAIPMLREMHSIFNWICSETSLDMFMWIQMDDLYATLLIVKYNMSYRERDKITLRGENPQPFIWKFLYGWLIFLGLLLGLVGPLMLFSTLTAGLSDKNEVLQADLFISLQTVQQRNLSTASSVPYKSVTYLLYSSESHANISTIHKKSDTYKCFTSGVASKYQYSTLTRDLQSISFPSFSDTTWGITPVSLATLAQSLSEDTSADSKNDDGDLGYEIVMEYTFLRKFPISTDTNTTKTKSVMTLDNLSRCILARRMGANVSNTKRCRTALNISNDPDVSQNTVILPSVYSSVLRLPSTTDSSSEALSDGTQFFGLSMKLQGAQPNRLRNWCTSCDQVNINTVDNNRKNSQMDSQVDLNSTPTLWWEFKGNPPSKYFKKPPCSEIPSNEEEGVFFAVNSDRSVPGAAISWIPTGSIIPLYTFIIIYVGSYVRSFLFNPIQNIPYTEIQHPDVLLEICEGVEIMRASAYDGHCKDEVGLYNFLLGVIKSNLMLRRLTEPPRR
jgi:hypothetical protein